MFPFNYSHKNKSIKKILKERENLAKDNNNDNKDGDKKYYKCSFCGKNSIWYIGFTKAYCNNEECKLYRKEE